MMTQVRWMPATLIGIWARQSQRDRRMLSGLGVFLFAVLVFMMVWQPAQQRLIHSERIYQQQRVLAMQVRQAQPANVRVDANKPLSAQVSASAVAAGLELQQFDVEGDLLRMTVSGDALALLSWLDQTEREGARLQSLVLSKHKKLLQARLVLHASVN